jgi:hypothetical protein
MRSPDIHDSAHAPRGSSAPALLTSRLGCMGATSTASTSAVTIDESHNGGTSGQLSSDDHVGNMGLLTAGRQTHIISHNIIAALSSAHLRPRRPHRPILASRHGGRI